MKILNTRVKDYEIYILETARHFSAASVVGTASVVAMVLGGELATNEALKEFKSLGTDLLAASINNAEDKRSSGKMDSLSLQQALDLQQSDPAITDIAPYTQLFTHDLSRRKCEWHDSWCDTQFCRYRAN